MAAGIGAGAPLSVQTEERRRWAARQRHWHLLHSDILQHSERVAPLDATRLTSEQEAALAACFAALEAEPPVGRYARAIGKISLDELSLCLKALGYRAEQELACLQEAAALAAADDPCRLSADMFMRLFGRALLACHHEVCELPELLDLALQFAHFLLPGWRDGADVCRIQWPHGCRNAAARQGGRGGQSEQCRPHLPQLLCYRANC